MNKQISVKGIVEEVEFRSFVYELATRLDLHGWVCGTTDGVEILTQGTTSNIESFICTLKIEAPNAVEIDDIAISDELSAVEYSTFEVQEPVDFGGAPALADVAICPDCLQELFNPRDRRYLYPFINCTHCGPRFTIMHDIPYHRFHTTMAEFEMCSHCRAEYEDPLSRWFRVEPIACPECGPFVALRETHFQFPNIASNISSIECRTAAILKARRLLREGYILGIKGQGGFQLACDASNSFTVEELRDRKGRAHQPFTVMALNVDIVRSICELSKEEEALLTSCEKPIVLLAKKQPSTHKVSKWVAPNLDVLGVMLPHTPLHYLLLNQTDPILASEPVPPLIVMADGNVSDEPVAIDNEDALYKLSPLADAFLVHNRDIYMRCQDSVVRVDNVHSAIEPEADDQGQRSRATVYLRRGRGYAPYTIGLPFTIKPTLALGGQMKNTICLARNESALLSHHIGDLTNTEAFESFEQSVNHLSRIFHFQPQIVAHDMYPEYASTRYAHRLNKSCIGIQHHHAHIVSCMADNGLDDRKVIGLSFDDSGYGTDGAMWGGEVLIVSFGDFERFAHLEYLPLPGGASSIHHPWRTAVGYAHALDIGIEELPFLKNLGKQIIKVVEQEVDKKFDAPTTSSMGRLFDAVASLIGLRNEVTYESQAVIELEALARPFVSIVQPYPYVIDQENTIRLRSMLQTIVQDVRAAKSIELIAARFHRTIADMAIDVCKRARQSTGLNEVALSGDTWQNQILLNLVRTGLRRNEFVTYFHRNVPTNDGGLSLGQAVIANYARSSENALAGERKRSKL